MSNILQITSNKAYTEHLGIVVSEMILVRLKTRALTENLDKAELDFQFDDKSNSIGTLLLHIAALEFKFQLDHFFNRTFSQEEYELFGPAAPHMMNQRLVHGHGLEFYTDILEEIRSTTLAQLETLDDEWLFKEKEGYGNRGPMNNYYLIKHIIHDEIAHQGQIKIIRKRLNR